MPAENDGPRGQILHKGKKNVGCYTIWDRFIEARETAAAVQMALSMSWLPNWTTQDSLFPLIFLGSDRPSQQFKQSRLSIPGVHGEPVQSDGSGVNCATILMKSRCCLITGGEGASTNYNPWKYIL